jgi:ferredoxin-thioredoxin reductase catalytic subunit
MKIKLNPDETLVNAIRNRLKVTGGMCPCIQEDLWNEDYRCPCKKFREEKDCCCNLYIKSEEETNE